MVKELEEITSHKDDDPQGVLNTEVERAVRSLKCNKSFDSDRIVAVMLQAGEEYLARQIHELCINACHEGTIHRNGANLFWLLLKRLKTQLDPYIPKEQASSRKVR